LHTVPAGQQLAVAVHAGAASQAGGLAMHVFELEQIFAASLQSASFTQATQAFPVGLSLQTGLGAAQSWPCVLTVQIGLHTLAAHFCPAAQSASLVHCGAWQAPCALQT
jgi:hypothetical protein